MTRSTSTKANGAAPKRAGQESGGSGASHDRARPNRDPARADHARPDPARPDHARADHARADSARPDHARADHARADSARHDSARHDHARAGDDHAHAHDVHDRNVCGPEEHARRGRDVVISDDQLERAAAIFRAAGDISRLKLLHRLSDGEWCVTELAEAANVGLSTVSQQLRLLRAERIVARRRAGKHIFYSLADSHVSDLIRSAIDHAAEPHTHAKPDDLTDE